MLQRVADFALLLHLRILIQVRFTLSFDSGTHGRK